MISNPPLAGAIQRREVGNIPNRHILHHDKALCDLDTGITGQHHIYYFMCRFTCSRCWKTAVELAHYHETLLNRGITVVLVGQGPYLRPATCLAAGLRLPFRLIVDDCGVLRRRFQNSDQGKENHRQSIVLVDDRGTVRYHQRVSSPGGRLRLASLMAVVSTLPSMSAGKEKAASRTIAGSA